MITPKEFVRRLKEYSDIQTFTDHHWIMTELLIDAYKRCEDPIFEETYFESWNKLQTQKTQTK